MWVFGYMNMGWVYRVKKNGSLSMANTDNSFTTSFNERQGYQHASDVRWHCSAVVDCRLGTSFDICREIWRISTNECVENKHPPTHSLLWHCWLGVRMRNINEKHPEWKRFSSSQRFPFGCLWGNTDLTWSYLQNKRPVIVESRKSLKVGGTGSSIYARISQRKPPKPFLHLHATLHDFPPLSQSMALLQYPPFWHGFGLHALAISGSALSVIHIICINIHFKVL